MKKILILLLSLLPILTFTSCDDKDDIRKDIDDLNARLDALKDDLESLNTSILSFQKALNGLVLITDCKKDEKGNYTLSLSDGTELVVYGGQPLGEIPTIGVNEDGNWTYTLNDETTVLEDADGNPYPAKPEDGKDGSVPQISIGADGYWYYAIGDGEPKRVEGRYNLANPGNIPGSIFADVTLDGNIMKFKFPGKDGATMEIPLLGGLNLTFGPVDAPVTQITVAKGASVTLTATQTYVTAVNIDPSPLHVVLSEDATNNLTIGAKNVNAGSYTVYFQIFSNEGYRLIKPLEVIVTE